MKYEFLRRLGALALCLVLALGLSAPSMAADSDDVDTDPPADVVTSISLSSVTLGLFVGESDTLFATTTPADAEVVWSSNDTGVATVDEGRVTAVAAGSTEIVATAGDMTATCIVTVSEPAPESKPVTYIGFSVSGDIQFKDSDRRDRSIEVEIRPLDATYEGISFTSDDDEVATIKTDETGTGGRYAIIEAVGPGETYVNASVVGQSGLNSARCKVTVSGIVLSDDALELTLGRSQNIAVDGIFGDAKNASRTEWYSSDNSIVSVSSGRLSARAVGKAQITAMRGNYSATCDVVVVEDTSTIITVDNVSAGSPMSFKDLRDDIDDLCREITGKRLSYITGLNVTPTQGILYYEYLSEADTGAGVGMTGRYYYSGSTTDDYVISDLTFVPRSTFSGRAEINYTGVSTDNTNFSGVIRIPVDAMEDVSYTTGAGQDVTFLGSDFNTICRAQTGRELVSVTFTLPLASRGTLYYNYTASGQYAEKVEANTSYRRVGNPNLDNVSFLPADGFTGSVRISYHGVDTAGASFTGYVTITVTDRSTGGAADVVFSGRSGSEVSFTASRFNTACREATGETLDYVQFKLPDSSDGTLYYGSGTSSERKVTESTRYYRNASPSLGSVSFVPARNAPDQIHIEFTGRSTEGTTFTGTVLIDYSGTGTGSSQAIRYSVYSGRAVQFEAADFNSECVSATGSTLNYVRFELPSASQGLLCYDYSSTASRVSNVSTTTRYYRSTSSSSRLDRVWFLADSRYTGTVSISYTGYSNDGDSFNGTVTVQVNSLTPAEVSFSGNGSQPILLSSTQLRNACNVVMDGNLSYIQFTSLPSSAAGRLYSNYSGFETGSQVVTGTQYYVSGTPGIDQLSFVPRGGFTGTAVATYTGVSTSGEQVSGRINFVVSSTGSSGYFNDMASYSWAVPAADYLYQNGVINGIGNNQYGPGQNIRRCDFVVMICRAYGFNDNANASSFADVPANSYYASAVAAASALGIVTGDGTNFRPDGQLTRQDAMVIIKRALEAAGWSLGGGSTAELSSFADGGSVAPYAQEAVATLVRLGAVNGDNGNLRPWDPINRAEVAVILHYVMTM